jgi:CubicO group peptidase (beta-lactamase class C family)/peptidoglycan/LPS O-acetylase OafA/YrhL
VGTDTALGVDPQIRSGERDRALDLLRALALGRVVLWHATGYAALTWVGALPTMVLLSGMLTGRSLARRGRRAVMADRLRRLLLPFWAYGLAAWTVMIGIEVRASRQVPWSRLVYWIVPIRNPQGTDWSAGWLSEPLWYVRLLFWLYLSIPVLSLLARRAPRVSLVLLALGTAAAEQRWGARWWDVQDLLLFSAFFVGGLAVARGSFPPFGKAWAWLVAVGAGVVTAWVVHRGLGDGVVNESHTLQLGVGLSTLGVAGLCAVPLRRAAAAVPRLVDQVSARSLSIYLWHPAAIAAVMWETRSIRSSTGDGVLVRFGVVVLSLVATAAIVWLVGPWEDRAARRPARPRSATGARASIAVAVTLALVAVVSPTQPAAFALPVPSQAPRSGRYDQPITGPTAATTPPASGSPARSRTLSPIPALDQLAPNADASMVARLDVRLQQFADRFASAGVGAVVLREGVARWTGGAGASPIPIDENIELMSITKTFTAALVLRAVDDGRIALDDEVGTLDAAPWFRLSNSVTFRQLLDHTSGLPNYLETPMSQANPGSIVNWQTALQAVDAAGRLSAPGEKARYSGTNYIVAALALAQREHAPIEDLIRRQLLLPLGLSRMIVGGARMGVPATGAGGMFGSTGDLARWAVALWRDASVLEPLTQAAHIGVNPSTMFGAGTVGYCPCGTDATGVRRQSAIGYSGGMVTVRYYSASDTIVVVASRTSIWDKGVPEALDAFAATLAAS